jgi:hypothetical protein
MESWFLSFSVRKVSKFCFKTYFREILIITEIEIPTTHFTQFTLCIKTQFSVIVLSIIVTVIEYNSNPQKFNLKKQIKHI